MVDTPVAAKTTRFWWENRGGQSRAGGRAGAAYHRGNVPDSLKAVHIRTLDLGLLQAGAGVKGEFEQRLKNVIDAVQKSPEPVLLFIDDKAHTIIGAGNQAGSADAATC